ncbi:hypothetical protein F5J12DRAFT_529487 [Pisolithus orientalis]|uniref:uncharacterized protein n=1 Tax=Pisolithus orientalis TaxID=936130 RepID=UPI0022246D02|nr:uncharacterized protein F5J12DRAFT_529487 [Pisolithus orientalis]KAI5988273.1 hypothetical protein F5J12DRAFT_529487 [Pisolithus orientalis]
MTIMKDSPRFIDVLSVAALHLVSLTRTVRLISFVLIPISDVTVLYTRKRGSFNHWAYLCMLATVIMWGFWSLCWRFPTFETGASIRDRGVGYVVAIHTCIRSLFHCGSGLPGRRLQTSGFCFGIYVDFCELEGWLLVLAAMILPHLQYPRVLQNL